MLTLLDTWAIISRGIIFNPKLNKYVSHVRHNIGMDNVNIDVVK